MHDRIFLIVVELAYPSMNYHLRGICTFQPSMIPPRDIFKSIGAGIGDDEGKILKIGIILVLLSKNWLTMAIGLFYYRLQSAVHLIPVNNLPESLNELNPLILVVKVVGVLPYINDQ